MSGMTEAIVNGVNIGASPSFPGDGLCPTCREPFHTVETSAVVAEQPRRPDGRADMRQRVDPPVVKGPYFVPCGHDARSCFPAVG